MYSHRQQSFIAQLSAPGAHLNFLDVLLGHPARIPLAGSGGSVFSGRFSERDDSHLLGHLPVENAPPPPTLYFRHFEEGYYLYVRTPGNHFGKGISRGRHGEIGAYPTQTLAPACFELLGPNGALILSDIPVNAFHCVLRERASGMCLHRHKRFDAAHTYVFAKRDERMRLTLNILERNAAWLSDPDEI